MLRDELPMVFLAMQTYLPKCSSFKAGKVNVYLARKWLMGTFSDLTSELDMIISPNEFN